MSFAEGFRPSIAGVDQLKSKEIIKEPLRGNIEMRGPYRPAFDKKVTVTRWAVGNTGLTFGTDCLDSGRCRSYELHFTPDNNMQGAKTEDDRQRYRDVFGYAMFNLLNWLHNKRLNQQVDKKKQCEPGWEEKYPELVVLPKQKVICYGSTNERFWKFMQKLLGEKYVAIDMNKIKNVQIDLEAIAHDSVLMEELRGIAEECTQKNYQMSVEVDRGVSEDKA